MAGLTAPNFRDRFYHPDLFIYLQPDPYPFGDGWSPYAFVRYNPLNYRDPYGRLPQAVIGAFVGAAIGGVGAWLKGGDWKDVLVAVGAGAAAGALASVGLPMLGGALAGGLMGGWSGGRAGYEQSGAGGILGGALTGAAIGTTLGLLTGWVGAGAGNWVATNTSGFLYRSLIQHKVGKAPAWIAARYSGMVAGGAAGGATSGVVGNNLATITVDLATGRPITSAQFWEATRKGSPSTPFSAPSEGRASGSCLYVRYEDKHQICSGLRVRY